MSVRTESWHDLLWDALAKLQTATGRNNSEAEQRQAVGDARELIVKAMRVRGVRLRGTTRERLLGRKAA